mmetsp:Transcript_68962/g.136716  ORF Transcript_68962/g.136716 Transcript_68962/m.136716 type:complete len:280 (-) Transcript_68962:158-997(-)
MRGRALRWRVRSSRVRTSGRVAAGGEVPARGAGRVLRLQIFLLFELHRSLVVVRRWRFYLGPSGRSGTLDIICLPPRVGREIRNHGLVSCNQLIECCIDCCIDCFARDDFAIRVAILCLRLLTAIGRERRGRRAPLVAEHRLGELAHKAPFTCRLPARPAAGEGAAALFADVAGGLPDNGIGAGHRALERNAAQAERLCEARLLLSRCSRCSLRRCGLLLRKLLIDLRGFVRFHKGATTRTMHLVRGFVTLFEGLSPLLLWCCSDLCIDCSHFPLCRGH